ncbi:LuxR C-terminal-related transcriptional regulator [Streptomyces sp. NPDC047061]|uniref:ATP-binding protein n=1 Tax=Streptomyces sp. NPDC047061 TaxID=3154605 RepID=UPI0033D787C4
MTIQPIHVPQVGNLPAALTSFVGRARDLAEARRHLGESRLLTLTGAGGVGKTRLALEVGAASVSDFEDGVWLVDLASVRDPALVVNATATALRVPDLGAAMITEQLAAFLARRSALIVLDNCEHLVDASAELVHTLLSAAPGLRMLTTSRHALGIHGEHVFAIPPLAPDDALELLRARATAVRSEFAVTDGNRAQVLRLCTDLDGLPLAIELAASRLRTLTVDEVLDRLTDRFGLLTGGSRVARPHQRTLRGLIDWSHDLCTPVEQLLWHRLSGFPGDFGLDAAEVVCSGDGIERDEVLDILDRLVIQSVVVPTVHEGKPRYRVLETIRGYGLERLVESGQEQDVRHRHHAFYVAFAERIANAWCGFGEEESLNRLRAERAHLRMALEHGRAPQATLALAAALRLHWCEGGFLGEGRLWLERALEAAPEPTPARAKALWVASWVATLQRDHAAAHRWLDEAAQLGGQLDDPSVCAHVQSLRGMVALFGGRMKEAVPLFEEAVTAHEESGDETSAIYALTRLATAQSHLGDPRGAQTCRQLSAVAEEHDERLVRAQAQWVLGYAAWRRGDLPEAVAMTRSALENAQGFNGYDTIGLMLEQLAWASAAGGHHRQAARLLGTARALRQDIGATIFTFGPLAVEQHVQCEEEVVRALGKAAYEEALAEGAAHRSPDEAIAYALHLEPEPPATDPLTPREREVAALVAEGMTNRQIATALGRSPRTIDAHIENILAKLGFGSRARIASWWTAKQASLT